MFVPEIVLTWWLMSIPIAHASRPAPVLPRKVDEPVFESGRVPGRRFASEANVFADPDDDVAGPRRGQEDALAMPEVSSDESEPAPRTGQRTAYRGLVTEAIVRAARSFLDLPLGAERASDVDGRHFVFVLERHYHPPGFVGAPTGWHKGVTVYETR